MSDDRFVDRHYVVTQTDAAMAHLRICRPDEDPSVLLPDQLAGALARPYCGFFLERHEKAAVLMDSFAGSRFSSQTHRYRARRPVSTAQRISTVPRGRFGKDDGSDRTVVKGCRPSRNETRRHNGMVSVAIAQVCGLTYTRQSGSLSPSAAGTGTHALCDCGFGTGGHRWASCSHQGWNTILASFFRHVAH